MKTYCHIGNFQPKSLINDFHMLHGCRFIIGRVWGVNMLSNKAKSAWNDWKRNEIGKIVLVKILYCCSPADPKCRCTDCLSVYIYISLIVILCFTLNRIVKHCQLISAILKRVYHLRLKINNVQFINIYLRVCWYRNKKAKIRRVF